MICQGDSLLVVNSGLANLNKIKTGLMRQIQLDFDLICLPSSLMNDNNWNQEVDVVLDVSGNHFPKTSFVNPLLGRFHLGVYHWTYLFNGLPIQSYNSSDCLFYFDVRLGLFCKNFNVATCRQELSQGS